MRVLALLLLATRPASAGGLTAEPSGCGGDAYSSAKIVEHRGELLVAMPDTLCADLSPQHPPAQLEIYAYPDVTPQVGIGGSRDPYEGRPPRLRRP